MMINIVWKVLQLIRQTIITFIAYMAYFPIMVGMSILEIWEDVKRELERLLKK